jgi:MFS family permease
VKLICGILILFHVVTIFGIITLGYLAGTLGSALLIEIKFFKGYKMLLASSGILLSGVALALMPHAVNVSAMYVLIVLQGLGFGSIDSLCNIVLPEIWGDRVQVQGCVTCTVMLCLKASFSFSDIIHCIIYLPHLLLLILHGIAVDAGCAC